jgi:hypothetical protein
MRWTDAYSYEKKVSKWDNAPAYLWWAFVKELSNEDANRGAYAASAFGTTLVKLALT